MTSFYNTITVSGRLLKKCKQDAEKQESIILDYFKKHSKLEFSACDVHIGLRINAPLTSVRRAITNLTSQGFLNKTGNKKIGTYGKPVNTWAITVKIKF
jgi:Fe2+ or Zn2+ uptake regulation protein